MDEQTLPAGIFVARDDFEVDLYSHARGYYLLLNELEGKLREWVKYGNSFTSIDDALTATRELVYTLKQEYHLPED